MHHNMSDVKRDALLGWMTRYVLVPFLTCLRLIGVATRVFGAREEIPTDRHNTTRKILTAIQLVEMQMAAAAAADAAEQAAAAAVAATVTVAAQGAAQGAIA